MTRIQRKPTAPGEILSEEFLKPMGLTQKSLCEHIGCDIKVINRIVNKKAAVSAEMALKLSAALSTTPDFWLNAQKEVDVYKARVKVRHLPKPLKRVA